jgi:hypothetical protein
MTSTNLGSIHGFHDEPSQFQGGVSIVRGDPPLLQGELQLLLCDALMLMIVDTLRSKDEQQWIQNELQWLHDEPPQLHGEPPRLQGKPRSSRMILHCSRVTLPCSRVNLNESLVALNCSRLTFYGSRMSQSDSG